MTKKSPHFRIDRILALYRRQQKQLESAVELRRLEFEHADSQLNGLLEDFALAGNHFSGSLERNEVEHTSQMHSLLSRLQLSIEQARTRVESSKLAWQESLETLKQHDIKIKSLETIRDVEYGRYCQKLNKKELDEQNDNIIRRWTADQQKERKS